MSGLEVFLGEKSIDNDMHCSLSCVRPQSDERILLTVQGRDVSCSHLQSLQWMTPLFMSSLWVNVTAVIL